MSSRVSHACQACAKARVKCEETKPCSRCRARSIVCQPPAPLPPRQHAPVPSVSSVPSVLPISPISPIPPYGLAVSSLAHPAPALQQAYPHPFPPPPGGTTPLLPFAPAGYSDHPAALTTTNPGSASTTVPLPYYHAQHGLTIPSVTAGFEEGAPLADVPPFQPGSLWPPNPPRLTNPPSTVWRPYGDINDNPADSPNEDHQPADHTQQLSQTSRDNILAVILHTNAPDPAETMRLAAAFLPIDVLNNLIHAFLNLHWRQDCQWIDVGPRFRLNDQRPEWLASAAAAGTAFVADDAVQNFRRVFDGPLQAITATSVRANSSPDLDIGMLQAKVLFQDISLWSSDHPVMEMIQSHLSIPITMIRSRNLFHHSAYLPVAVDFSESEAELERKRSQWSEQELWKRLVFHCYLRDAQVSIARQIPPQISPVELTLPLPESCDIWQARTTHEWTRRYEDDATGGHGVSCKLDISFAANIYLHGVWSIIWQLQQLCAVRQAGSTSMRSAYGKHQPYYASATAGSVGSSSSSKDNSADTFPEPHRARQQELVGQLQQFRAVLHGWYELSVQESLMLELLQLHLHISLNDLCLFAEQALEPALGPNESKASDEGPGLCMNLGMNKGAHMGMLGHARRGSADSRHDVLEQRLRAWSHSTDGRCAVWHAGQIVACFRQGLPSDHQQAFYAVALQQAALALWVWGMLRRATGGSSADETTYPLILVDGCEALEVQRFVQFGQGTPVLHAVAQHQQPPGNSATATPETSGNSVVSLSEPQACMDVVLAVLRAAYGYAAGPGIDDFGSMPPLVVSLCRRIERLAAAASRVL